METTSDKPKTQQDLAAAQEYLAKLINKDLGGLIDEFRRNPAEFLDNLRQALIPVLGFLDQFGDRLERELRMDVYADLGALLAQKLPVDAEAIQAWIACEVEDAYSLTSKEKVLAEEASPVLSAAKIALRCKYKKTGNRAYVRIAQAYLGRTDESDKVDKLESERAVTMDELPTEVTESFNIHGETEFEFAIL